MAIASWTDVVDVAPELGGTAVATSAQTALLAYAETLCNNAWGDLRKMGVIYLAAHLATLSKRAGGGTVTSETVGSLSRSYATPQSLKGALGLTGYGATYSMLLSSLPVNLGVVY